MEEDAEIRLLEQKKLEALRKRIKASAPQPTREKTDREIVEGLLYDRGSEVLEAAYESYPVQTDAIVKEIASMIKNGRMVERISGGELYSVFRQIGLRFKLKTSIRVQDRGKLVDLSEKLTRIGEE